MSTNDHLHKDNWGAADFERYYKDAMSAQERYALEKAALDDPFLQDALDGYAFTSNPMPSLENMRAQLTGSAKEDATLVWFRQPAFQKLIRVAAILLIIAAVTFVLFNNKETDTKIVANNQNTIGETGTNQSTEIKKDSNLTVIATDNVGNKVTTNVPLFNQPTLNDIPQIASTTAPSRSQPSAINTKPDSVMNDVVVVNNNAANMKSAEPIAANKDTRASSTLNRIPISIVRGQVTNQFGLPVANATIKDQVNNQIIATDNNGNFELNNSRNISNIEVDVNASGYKGINSSLNNNASNKIILLEERPADSNAELVNAALPKKKNFVASEIDSSNKEDLPGYFNMNRVTLKNATPLAGWETYNAFIDNNLQSAASLGASAKGVVVVSFNINEMGKAENISIKTSLDTKCDAEAIRFIQNSPAFKRMRRSGKVEATVKF